VHIKIKSDGSFNIILTENFREVSTDESVEYWKNLMINPFIKIIFIRTDTSVKKTSVSHATWTIIDKVRNIVEFFDPHGSHVIEKHPDYWSLNWVDTFKNMFQCKYFRNNEGICFIPKNYRILAYDISCPSLGFQTYELRYGIKDETAEKGFCMLWSIFLLDIRLGNLEYGTRDIQLDILNSIMSQSKYESKSISEKRQDMGTNFKRFIRDYGLYWRHKYLLRDVEMDVDL
jgi:hypothetical protein